MIEELLDLTRVYSANWKRPKFKAAIGPQDPAPFDIYEEELHEKVEAIKILLHRMSDLEISDSFKFHMNKPLGNGVRPNAHLIALFDAIMKLDHPAWFSGGFGVVGMEPDYEYWARMKTWSLDEATALSSGFEPVEKNTILNVKGNYDDGAIEF